MCIRAGNDELDTVKMLMSMSLNSVIARVFDLDLENIDPKLDLRRDLRMDDIKAQVLCDEIADCFDGLSIDLSLINTLNQLFDSVIDVEFEA